MLMKAAPSKAFPVIFLSFSISDAFLNNRAWSLRVREKMDGAYHRCNFLLKYKKAAHLFLHHKLVVFLEFFAN